MTNRVFLRTTAHRAHAPSIQRLIRTLAATRISNSAQQVPHCSRTSRRCHVRRSTLATSGNAARDEIGWKSLRDAWLGRKSGRAHANHRNWLKPAKPELKRAVGQALNELKAHVETALESRRAAIEAAAEQAALAREREDLSLPGVIRPLGSRHPLRQTFEEIERIFLSLGYSVVAGPEMETPYYNFEALNIPEHHPARDNMDTFYMAAPAGRASRVLLRTHTSPMQVRTMEKQQPPVRIIVPGKVYRRDNPDATHGFMFHQIEGFAVDTDITFCDFKGTVEYFVREFLGPESEDAPAAELFSVHRAFGGSGRDVRVLRRQGLQRVQAVGMD